MNFDSSEETLRRVFQSGFAARDIAEPLPSFDLDSDTRHVREYLESRRLRVIGLRQQGNVSHFIYQDQIDARPLHEQALPIEEAALLPTSAPFQQVVQGLGDKAFLLVTTLGQAVGVIEPHGLEKAPMRMWLFGMVTLFEMRLTSLIGNHYGETGWSSLVSDSRLQKAKTLQAERQRRNQSVALLDCLQLGDKGQLLARNELLRERYWNRSRNHIEKVIKDLERLRNNLAHSQGIVHEDWATILRLANTMDDLLEAAASPIAEANHQDT